MTAVARSFPFNSLKNYFQAMGNVAYAGSQLLILLVLLKNGGFRSAGDFSLSQAIIAPLFGLVSFSMRPYWVAGVIRNLDLYQFLRLRIVSIFGGALLAIVVKGLLFSTVDNSIFFLVFTLKTSELISDAFYAHFDVAGKSPVAGKLLMAKALVISLCCGFCFLLGATIATFQYALYFAFAAILALELVSAKFTLSAFVDAITQVRVQLKHLIPLVSWTSASSVVTSVTGFLPRYFLESLQGREAVGYYSIVAAPAAVVLMICTGLAQTELNKFATAYSEHDWTKFFGILYNRGFLLAALTLVAACSIAGFTIILDSNEQDLFPAKIGYDIAIFLLLFFPLYGAQLLSYAVMPLARLRETFALTVVSLLVQISVSSTLIHWYALYGAVATSVIGGVIQALGFSLLLKHHFHGQRT